VDDLAADWCGALDAAHASLDAAALYLGAAELGVHSRRIEADRASAVALLRELAHEQHREGMIVSWLAVRQHSRAMLGLPNEIDACIFDLDGVTTSEDVQAEAWGDTLDPLLLAHVGPHAQFVPFDRRHEYEEHLAARPRLQGIHSFLGGRGLSLPEGSLHDLPGTETVAAVSARKDEALRTRLDRESVAAFEASHAYIEAARTLGIRIGLVSASVHAEAMIERAGLKQLVDARVDGVSIETAALEGKPAPDTVLTACRLLGISPDRAASFETTVIGLQAAREAGVGFIVGIERYGELSSAQEFPPDVIVRDVGALFLAG
jgi:beta-phosphoglucomutase-like phosphatase (HAD superfamily)